MSNCMISSPPCSSEEESNSLEQAQKRKGKFGILELATKEFEDESEVRLHNTARPFVTCNVKRDFLSSQHDIAN